MVLLLETCAGVVAYLYEALVSFIAAAPIVFIPWMMMKGTPNQIITSTVYPYGNIDYKVACIVQQVKSKLASKLNYAMLQAYNELADVRTSVDHLQHNVRIGVNLLSLSIYTSSPIATLLLLISQFKCCGLSSYADWKANTWYSSASNPSNGSVPESCCRNPTPGCGAGTDPSGIFAQVGTLKLGIT